MPLVSPSASELVMYEHVWTFINLINAMIFIEGQAVLFCVGGRGGLPFLDNGRGNAADDFWHNDLIQ